MGRRRGKECCTRTLDRYFSIYYVEFLFVIWGVCRRRLVNSYGEGLLDLEGLWILRAATLLMVLMTIRNSRMGQMSLRNAVEYEVRYSLGGEILRVR